MPTAARRKTSFILSVLVMLSFFQVAQLRTHAEQLPIRTYTTADGLARDEISRIVQDSHGFLWFCTSEGLSRFDGYEFTNYGTEQGLPHRAVRDLVETRSGAYWIATGGGVCRFDPIVRQQPKSNDGNSSQRADGLAHKPGSKFELFRLSEDNGSQWVNALIEDRAGVIWCATIRGLYRLDLQDGQWRLSLVDIGIPTNVSDDIRALLEDHQGRLWVGAASGLYRRWPDGRVERYTTRHGLPFNDVKALLEDREGRLWAATTQGLCQIVSEPEPTRNVVARVYTTKEGLSSNWVMSLFQSSDGRLWAGTLGGLAEFIPTAAREEERFRSYTTAHGLSDAQIEAIAEDRNGNLWIGTETGGAMKLATEGLTNFGVADGLGSGRIASILENQAGELCVIDGLNGKMFINRFDGKRFNTIKPVVPADVADFGWGWYQTSFQDHTGEWWVPTANGLFRYPKISRVEQLAHTRPKAVYARESLPADEVFRLYEDSRGDVWISVIGPSPMPITLVRWERKSGKFHRYSLADGLPITNAPTAFCEDARGNLWIGFYENTLARYADGRFTVLSTADGLPVGMVRGLYLDQSGRLWIATGEGGLARIDDPAAEHPRFATYTTAEGLSSNQVSCITEDQWGRIYIGTGRGLDRLDPATGRIKHYTEADGLGNNFVNVAFRDRAGALWFGTLQGLSRLVPKPDRPQLPPPIFIGGLRIAGVERRFSELGEAELSGLELGPSQNQIEIGFLGLSYGSGDSLRYQYMLEGADRDWSALTDQRSVNYASLRPGQYRFLVRAVSADNTISATPAVVTFRILPPIWQRWWFITLAALFVGLAVYAVYRYRIGRLLELERVRTRIATDLHDDIGSSLSQVAILSEVARQQVSSDESNVVKPLSMISRISLESMEAMSDIVWAINPQKERLHDLTQRMRRFASDIFTASNIQFSFHAPRETGGMKMGPDARRQVFLVFKESVNNIVRHSCCTLADIELRTEGAWLVLKVSDNGKGFEVEQSSDGNGLANMRARAEKMNGYLTVISNNGEGTTLTFKVPCARRGWRMAAIRRRRDA